MNTWIWPIWITLGLALSLAAGIILRHKVRPAEAIEQPSVPDATSDPEHARVLIRELQAEQRRVLQDDRDGALRILAERGLVNDATLHAALAADLGTLFTLDPVQP